MDKEEKAILNVRTREKQIEDLTSRFREEGAFSHADDRDAAAKHITEAEARGRAEQRRKDEDECVPVHQYCAGGAWHDCSLEVCASQNWLRTLYTRPVNIAALEDRVEELEAALTRIADSDTFCGSQTLRHTARSALTRNGRK